MLIRLADWLTRRAARLMPIPAITRKGARALKAAWTLRNAASWLRGGAWRSFASLSASADRAARQSTMYAPPTMEWGA